MNLIKQITMWTQFAHLQYYAEYNQKIFETISDEPQIWSLKHIFSLPTNKEKLYSLFKEHVMTRTEIQKIKQYYATVYELAISRIKVNI